MYEDGRKKVKHNVDRCMRCGGCVAVCPEGVFTLYEAALVIDYEKCVGCGECVKACPMGALRLE